MSATILPLNPNGCARISAVTSGFRIALRSDRVSVDYDRRTAGDTAEFAVLLRDEGGWRLRFDRNAVAIELLVAEIDEEGRS